MNQSIVFILYIWCNIIHSSDVYRYIGIFSNNSHNTPFKLTPTGIELPCCSNPDIMHCNTLQPSICAAKEGMFKIIYNSQSSGYHGIYEPQYSTIRKNKYYVIENKTFDIVNYNDIPQNLSYFKNHSDSNLYLTSNIVVIIYDSINYTYYKMGNYSESIDLTFSFYSSLLHSLSNAPSSAPSANSTVLPTIKPSDSFWNDLFDNKSNLLFYALTGAAILGCCVLILCIVVIVQHKKLKRKKTDNIEEYINEHNIMGIAGNRENDDNYILPPPIPPVPKEAMLDGDGINATTTLGQDDEDSAVFIV